MTTQVEPEEVEAILEQCAEAARAVAEVAQRDFRKPRRLSTSGVHDLRRRLEATSPGMVLSMLRLLGSTHAFELLAVRESNADEELGSLEAPLCAARFAVDGQPGWVLWETNAALACIDRMLGSNADDEEEAEDASEEGAEEAPRARALTRVERRMLASLCEAVVAALVRPFGLEPQDFAGVSEPFELGSWRDGRGGADSYRLSVRIAFDGPGGSSAFHVLVPGLRAAVPDEVSELDRKSERRTPDHLESVGIHLSARLGSVEIPLAQLLSLEEGDVIPLGRAIGEPLELCAEERVLADAALGKHRSRLAVRILSNRSASDD